MRPIALLFVLVFSSPLFAQTEFNDRLDWAEEPRATTWAGMRRVEFGYQIMGADAGGKGNQGATTPAVTGNALPAVAGIPRDFVYDDRPTYSRSFRAPAKRGYAAELIAIEWEDVQPAAGFDPQELPTEFRLSISTARQPGGTVVGLVTAPALIRSDFGGAQRLKSIRYRLVPASRSEAKSNQQVFAESSVLARGETYKVAVETNGVYRIDRAFLADELNINVDQLDPRTLKVFGQRGGMLPELVNDEAPDDLEELAVFIEGESDGRFDGGDYLLFYGYGPDRSTYDAVNDRYRYQKNIYTDRNYYFIQISEGTGRRVTALPAAPPANAPTTTYDAVYRFEEDRNNILHRLGGNNHGSGQFWFGEFFRSNRERNYGTLFTVPGLDTEEPVDVRAQMALRTDVSSRFFIELNGESHASAIAGSISFGREEQFAAAIVRELSAEQRVTSEDLRVRLSYPIPAGAERSEAYLDWIEVRARRRLSFPGSERQFGFRDARGRSANAQTFRFTNAPADLRVWRVDGADVRAVTVNDGTFSAATRPDGQPSEFVAFRSLRDLPSPIAQRRVEPQNLHALGEAGMIIVTHPNFRQQAERLAEHRRTHNGLTTHLVTTEEIYNEFSSGRADAAAIRNFGRMIFERSGGRLQHLLLFGDGSFDHRNILELGTNFIPTYQFQESFTQVESFPADDFFAIFEPSDIREPLGPMVNVGIGRIPVKTGEEARGVVQKLIRYDTDRSTLGDWRTRMVFVGDDEDNSRHTDDVNRVANAVAERKPDLNFDKLYFDLFPQQSISAGERYPDVTEGLDRAIFRGAVAVTYLGHGGPRGWAQERVLTIPQIRNWRRPANAEDPIQPPIFITATCTFSNFDDATFNSAGEEAILTPDGGAAALLSTTRPVFSDANYALTNNTVLAMLARPEGQWRSLGDVIRISKNQTLGNDRQGSLSRRTQNTRKFALIGDPAMVISFPEHSVRTTAVDTMAVQAGRLDTVRALQQLTISGEVTDLNGKLLDGFNGTVFPTIYDKPQQVETLQQDPGSPARTFTVQRNIVFRGRATVREGKFTFDFVVPSDIDYSFGRGKVSYYAADPNQFTDAAGFYDQLVIGGTGNSNAGNDEGPEIDIFLNETDFVAGDAVGEDPILIVDLADDLGINVTGNSIGHDLEAVLDEDTRNPIVLNDYYEADVDDFRSGTVRYPLFDLEPGKHTVTVRAWDVSNKSNTATTDFLVAEDGRSALRNVLNYPNPFTTNTCFQFDHSLVGQDVAAIVQIYTVTGKLVKTLEANFPFSDGEIRQDDCIQWDGLDEYGDPLARGVYLYQIRLRGEALARVDGALEKLVILR